MSRYKMPIIRISWKSALEGLKTGTMKLLRCPDGHAECLISCGEFKQDGNTPDLRFAGFYLTKRSVKLLDKHMGVKGIDGGPSEAAMARKPGVGKMPKQTPTRGSAT